MRAKLKNKIKRFNKKYKRIESLLTPSGFTLTSRYIFYGEYPFSLYCGKMEDYQIFITNVDNIKERYLKSKMESLGINSNIKT